VGHMRKRGLDIKRPSKGGGGEGIVWGEGQEKKKVKFWGGSNWGKTGTNCTQPPATVYDLITDQKGEGWVVWHSVKGKSWGVTSKEVNTDLTRMIKAIRSEPSNNLSTRRGKGLHLMRSGSQED